MSLDPIAVEEAASGRGRSSRWVSSNWRSVLDGRPGPGGPRRSGGRRAGPDHRLRCPDGLGVGPESPALDNSDSSRTRFAGGFIRLHMVASLGVEVAMDYQSTTNPAETAKIRNMPIQVSGMLLPVKKTFAPYVLAGIGWYKHRVKRSTTAMPWPPSTRPTSAITRARRAGEVRQARRDLRGLPARMGRCERHRRHHGALRSADSVTKVVGLLASLAGVGSEESSISRGGSMWTGGLTIYF